MKTLNIDWNNTDWSVSKSTPATHAGVREGHAMKTNTENRSVAPRYIRVLLPSQRVRSQNDLNHLLQQARREAIALANTTGYPTLFLPLLQEEKEAAARAYWRRRQVILESSREIIHQLFENHPESAAA